MARIEEQQVVITLSKLVSDKQTGEVDPLLSDDMLETLQEAIEGLVGDSSIIVEITSAEGEAEL